MGGGQSLSFTVIGDTVNTASRLQRLTHDLSTPLVVGDPVVCAMADRRSASADQLLAALKDRGEHELRGRGEPVRIWTRDVP